MIARIGLSVIDPADEDFPRNATGVDITRGPPSRAAKFMPAGTGEALKSDHDNNHGTSYESSLIAVR